MPEFQPPYPPGTRFRRRGEGRVYMARSDGTMVKVKAGASDNTRIWPVGCSYTATVACSFIEGRKARAYEALPPCPALFRKYDRA